MKTDEDLTRGVEAELKWSPDVNATDIAVKVTGGVVALSGFVRTYFEKSRAEDPVKRVAGVTGVANDIVVRAAADDGVQDPDITRAAVAALQSELPTSADNLKVFVRDGHVTLEGKVEWNYQRDSAERAVRRVRGVTTIYNDILVAPKVQPVEVKRTIEEAFRV